VVLCDDKARLTSFGKAKMPLWLLLISAIMISQIVQRYSDGTAERLLGLGSGSNDVSG
jgi:hypothetical protein